MRYHDERRFRSDSADNEPRGHGGPHGRGGRRRGGPGMGPEAFGGRGPGRGRGFGRPGGWQQADLPSADGAAAWVAGRLPDGWFTGAPTVAVDREEISVIGELPAPELPADADAASAAQGRITRFREETREERMRIDAEAQARFGRSIAWGASIGDEQAVFTNLAVPVMTRLRQAERQVLDTLVDAGVARSRSDALVWCVRLVGEHTDTWLSGLRSAMSEVDKLRSEGPEL